MKKRLKSSICLTVMFCLAFANGYSRNHYVATNGNNNDDGTIDRPYATISKAAAVAQAGDFVIIKSGTYTLTANIKPTNSGTAQAPITYMAEVSGQAIINGQSTVPSIASREGLIHVSGKNWLVFDGLRIINSGFFGIIMRDNSANITVKNCSTFMTGSSGICGAGASNITVLNNTVQKACQAPGGSTVNTSECITMASVNTFEVAYNTVFDRLVDVNNGGEGIDAKNSCLDGKIHHNIVYDLIRVGIYVDAYAQNLSNIEVYANIISNCSAGINVASEVGATLTGVQIHDNIVRDMSGVGIRLAGYLDNGPLQDVDVYNNTIVRCGKTKTISQWENCGILVEATNVANRNFNIRNNLITECTNGIRTNGQTYPIIDNNLIFGTTTFSGTNRISSNPLLVNSTANDFRLQKNSPAIDKAAGTPISTTDFAGVARPLDGDGNGSMIADIGAYEAATLIIPITLSEFKGFTIGQTHRLTWKTASEQKNLGFDIERSSNGKDFEKWRFVASKSKSGNSNAPLEYTIDDNTPLSTTTYYRLKQIDFDAQFSYSPIVALQSTEKTIAHFYPNPAHNQVFVENIAPNTPVELYDVLGRKVLSQTANTGAMQMDISGLNKGVYLFKIMNTNNVSETGKWIKN